MRKSINWQIFLILLGLSLISIICIFPYIISLYGETLNQAGVPLEIFFTVQFIQSAILFAAAIYFGLYFTKKIDFHLPLLEAILNKNMHKINVKDLVGKSILMGALTAAVIYLLDIIFTIFGSDISTHQNYAPIWQKLLASLYGGIAEEIIMRLFLMTLLIWISMKMCKKNTPSKTGIVLSIFIVAVIFGLGHLPITASLTQINPLVITRAIVLNGVGGVLFGWLFWKKGFESAMVAHFTADVFLLTLFPLLFG